jgi:hypothetical protein
MMNKEQLEEDLENFKKVDYRMDNEGLEYCFKHYSSFEEIKDKQFHILRLQLMLSIDKIKEYVNNKIYEIESSLEEIDE